MQRFQSGKRWVYLVPVVPLVLAVIFVTGAILTPRANLIKAVYAVVDVGMILVITGFGLFLLGMGWLLTIIILLRRGVLSPDWREVKLARFLSILDIALPVGFLLFALYN